MEYFNMIYNETRIATADIESLPEYMTKQLTQEQKSSLDFIYDDYHDAIIFINEKDRLHNCKA